MTICVVPISLEYAASFRTCLDSVAKEGRYLAQIKAKPLDDIIGFVSNSIANDAAHFVALNDQQVVGWADIIPSWAHATKHCGRLGMGVLAPFRGRGIGKQLLTTCIAKAEQNGITRIELEARSDNAIAIELYRQLGFQLETVKKKALRFDNKYYDAAQMYLLVGDANEID